jgi:hypothetical protein
MYPAWEMVSIGFDSKVKDKSALVILTDCWRHG